MRARGSTSNVWPYYVERWACDLCDWESGYDGDFHHDIEVNGDTYYEHLCEDCYYENQPTCGWCGDNYDSNGIFYCGELDYEVCKHCLVESHSDAGLDVCEVCANFHNVELMPTLTPFSTIEQPEKETV